MNFEALIQEYRDIPDDDQYEAIVKATQFLKEGKIATAIELLELVQDDMEKDQRIRVRTHLDRLMQYVFLCIDFSEKMRDNDAMWLKQIREHRDEIAYIMAIQPKIDRKYLESIWEEEQKTGLDFAQTYEKVQTEHLTWEQVFEEEYGKIDHKGIDEKPIIDLFEWLLKQFSEKDQEEFISALANMIPASPESIVEWQGRLHYHENDRIQAGAYLRVFPAIAKPEIKDFREIMHLFLENRTQEMWKMMQDDLYYFVWYAQKPYQLEMGKALHIQENMAAFMFSFWGGAQPNSQKHFEKRNKKLALQNTV